MSHEVENDWITEAGYRAVGLLINFSPGRSHRTGYVLIPRDHPLNGLGYGVSHGSITYAAFSGGDYPVKTEEGTGSWFGFDCGHYNDTLARCSAEYVRSECEKLARQLKEVTDVWRSE